MSSPLLRAVVFSLGLATLAMAADPAMPAFDRPSAGDNPGEAQPPPSGFVIPPSPPLSPTEALASFRLPPGYRMEVVASEPLVDTPVVIDFDPDGRMWVVEMRGYQNNPEGSDRLKPTGRIVVLEDTDDDGKMDRRVVYMEGLVLPRGVKVLSDGVLVAEPPYIWHTRDIDGDLRMDEKSVVVDDYGVRDANPGHAPNGLVLGLDNWLHSGTYSARLRRVDGAWVKDPVPVLGHWGLGMDDFGRTYMSTNTAPLRVNLVSSHYQLRNPNHEGGGGVFEPMTGNEEREVFPIRPNPGINRGYVKGMLRKDGRLARYTAGCGTSIFRGDRLPDEMKGSHFFCEPAGNLVRRTAPTEHPDGRITGVNAHPQAEFLASTDERFRPVNTHTAPDGTLYIVDMYRGVLESHPFVTTFLKRQIYGRGLIHPQNRGRIYRVVHESTRRGPRPRLGKASAEDLVKHLVHPNGWWRDTAQRLLIERVGATAAPALRTLARGSQPEIPRLHALWTLEGMGALNAEDILLAARDSSHRIRAAALRWAEPTLRSGGAADVVAAVLRAIDDSAAVVRLQAAASLGELRDSRAVEAFSALLTRHLRQPYLADAVVCAAGGREHELLMRLADSSAWSAQNREQGAVIAMLGAAIFRSREVRRIEELLAWAGQDRPSWQRLAVLQSVTKPNRLTTEPKIPTSLTGASDAAVRAATRQLAERLAPDRTAATRPLSKAEQELFDVGAKNYGVYCAQCHQANGRGAAETGPALAGSKWALGPPEIAAKIVLHGKQGAGAAIMPPWGNVLDDRDIASILTYVRREWENKASPVSIEDVRRARSDSKSVTGLWTDETLTQHAESRGLHP